MTKIEITVKPGSKKGDQIVANPDGSLTIFLRARPIDGAANAALLELLSSHFGVPKTRIKILKGHNSRKKLLSLED